MHVTQQAQFISETYRRKITPRVSNFDRLLDGAVILGALYTVAMYKFVDGRFTMGSSALLFPDFLKHPDHVVGASHVRKYGTTQACEVGRDGRSDPVRIRV